MLEEVRHKLNTQYLRQLDKAFTVERRNIENQILSWYERLADNNGVSLAEAKKMLHAKERKEFRWTVEEYIRYGQENAINQQWLKELENASAKAHIDRLQALEIELGQKVEKIYHEYGESVKGLFTRQMKDLYTEASKISGVDLAFDTRKVKSVLGKPWTSDGKTFSERIWGKKVKLHNHLHTELTRMCITGETPKRVIKNLAEKFNVEMHQAKTLVNTESAYFASTTQKQIYDDLDVEKYEILAEVDDRTSEICLNLNGHVFDAKDFEPGVTAPPFHPNCRTITAPWFPEDEEIELKEPFYDNTNGWQVVPLNKSKVVEDLTEYTTNETTYKVDGKHVVLDYSKEEKEIADLIAGKYGKNVQMVPKINFPMGISTPDYLINGNRYDLKTIQGVGKSVIFDAIKKKIKQADNFVIDISKSKIGLDGADEQIKKVFYSKHTEIVDEVLLIKNKNIIKSYKRK